ncbi:uncharacterized protein [Salmo salar]|uniref:Uncharacterized protein n=1 Tax=Salmo salar TaxID=8030 RepID=A0A1S3M964_SALSA|nr:uncharacterized protein LOC106571320 [Salmo salar]|eukprot:XP_013999733.1 PREDICTED: uncharacterized protein LOC106571320 [Salmo salar]
MDRKRSKAQAEAMAADLSDVTSMNLLGVADVNQWIELVKDYSVAGDHTHVLSESEDGDGDDDYDMDHSVITDEVEMIMIRVRNAMEPGYDKEMDKIRQFDCKCGEGRKEDNEGSCTKKLYPDRIYKYRRNMASLTQRLRDIAILGVLNTIAPILTVGAKPQCSKTGEQTQRNPQTLPYLVGGVPVCEESFLFIYGISRERLIFLHRSYQENGTKPPTSPTTTGRPHNPVAPAAATVRPRKPRATAKKK